MEKRANTSSDAEDKNRFKHELRARIVEFHESHDQKSHGGGGLGGGKDPVEALERTMIGTVTGRVGREARAGLKKLSAAMEAGDALSAKRALRQLEVLAEDRAKAEHRSGLNGYELSVYGAVRRRIRAMQREALGLAMEESISKFSGEGG